MSLKATNSSIIIQNAAGVEKFNSDNKLVYKKGIITGSCTLGSTNPMSHIALFSSTFDSSKDFIVAWVTVTYTNGNQLAGAVGAEIQMAGPMISNFEYATTSASITSYELIGAIPAYNGTSAGVRFSTWGWSEAKVGHKLLNSASKTTSLTYRAYHLSYR